MSHSRQTEHYGLPLYNGTDIINPLTDFNNANEAIDEAIYDANSRSANAIETATQAKETATQAEEAIATYDARIEAVNDKANSAQQMLADEFNPLKDGGYKVGDIVRYDNQLYEFVNQHSGAWDASHVKVVNIVKVIEAIAIKIVTAESEV